ncbi:hypothetical protein BD769DRAFT_1502655 [Suillus cothurnatus]|nr:hypothetical protein BD769DRAFT_1502655 [Suillus cothurnatus]
MLKYPDAPNSWYFVVFLLAFVVALVVSYKANSTLPLFGQMIGGYLHKGSPGDCR